MLKAIYQLLPSVKGLSGVWDLFTQRHLLGTSWIYGAVGIRWRRAHSPGKVWAVLQGPHDITGGSPGWYPVDYAQGAPNQTIGEGKVRRASRKWHWGRVKRSRRELGSGRGGQGLPSVIHRVMSILFSQQHPNFLFNHSSLSLWGIQCANLPVSMLFQKVKPLKIR